jgi:hypothetical protein
MATFAKLDENNKVLSVHVVNDEDIIVDGIESEQKGIEFLTSIHTHSNWKQTSYNSRIRKNYAAIGYTYDADRDAFIAPKPFPSWSLNEQTCRWEPPTTMPTDGKHYFWNEADQSWSEITE